MTDFTNTWYCNAGDQSTTGYYAVAKRQPSAAVAVGKIVRQFSAPAINSERCFVCIQAGTTSGATDAPWVLDRAAKTNDNTVIWQECTGVAAVNGDAANTPTWSQARAISVTTNLGTIIKRNNGASFQICQTATGAMGATEPAFSDTAGVLTIDGSTSWISLGPVGSFIGGGAPHARLANAGANGWHHANNTIYVGDNHAESQASPMTLAFFQASNIAGSRVLCHDHAGNYPPAALTTGATVSVSGPANSLTYNGIGSVYFYGITFRTGVATSSLSANLILSPNAGSYVYFDNCSFRLMCTTPNNSSSIFVGGTDVLQATVVFNNCTVGFASQRNLVAFANGVFVWQNTGLVLASGSAVPDVLLAFGTITLGTRSDVVLEAIDLSQIPGLLWQYNYTNLIGNMVIKDCKLNAAWTVSPVLSQPPVPGSLVQLARSGSDPAGHYQSARYTCDGTETTEITITRVGGAVDPTNQPQSRKIVTTANPQWQRPFQAEPYAIWNATVGADVTVSVRGTIQDVLPNNDEIWLELEYLSSSTAPLGTIVNTTKAGVLAPSAPVLADNSHWNGGGSGAGWSPFKLVATLSSPQPGLPGYIHARVRAARPSATFFIDPLIVLS